jgi:hypothetical protein
VALIFGTLASGTDFSPPTAAQLAAFVRARYQSGRPGAVTPSRQGSATAVGLVKATSRQTKIENIHNRFLQSERDLQLKSLDGAGQMRKPLYMKSDEID